MLLTTTPGLWEQDVRLLTRLIVACATRHAHDRWGETPVFGALDRHEWGVLAHKHFDHHLRQFGV